MSHAATTTQILPAQPQRLHALDSLRAAMMLLGIVLHGALAYMTIYLGEGWPFQDQQTHVFFDALVSFIHAFRMPVFFVIAGFFAALLYQQRGPQELILNRLQRVALPLLLSWCVLFPVIIAGFAFAQNDFALTSHFFANPHLYHLWFLRDLLIFYAAALLLIPLISQINMLLINIVGLFIVLIIITWLSLQPTINGELETSVEFIPHWHTVVAYGVFFVFGCLLYQQQAWLNHFSRYAWWYSGIGLAAFLGLHYLLTGGLDPTAAQGHLIKTGLVALRTWGLVFGIIGLFLRYLAQASKQRRYMADAAYWIYLIHLPCVIWLQGILARTDWSPWLKFSLVIAATAVITVISYQFWVRATVIGQLLNGRRYAAPI